MNRVKYLVALLIAAALLLPAAPAWAHTSLAGSNPANLSRLSSAPPAVTLSFTDPVDPETVTITVQDIEGSRHPGAQRRPADGSSVSAVTFDLPELPDGTYGIAWQSIGDDGHRAVGEVVLGIGDVTEEQITGAEFQSLTGGERVVDLLGAVGRFAWYVGLSFAMGALFSLWWLSASRTEWNSSERSLWKLAGRWLAFGQMVALVGFGVLSASRIAILGGSLEGEPGVLARLLYGFSSLGGAALVGTFAALGWGLKTTRGVPKRPFASARAERWKRIAAALVLAGFSASLGGHLAVYLPLEIATAVRGAHLLSAALWIGPLFMAALWLATQRRRGGAGSAEERAELLSGYFKRFARIAGWTLAVLIATGVEALWVNVGTSLFASNYGLTLTVKVLLLILGIVPLAWYHRRTVERSPGALIKKPFRRSLRLELTGLASVLVLASALAVLNPSAGPADDEPPAGGVLSSEPVANVAECAELTIGQANCYNKFFSALMKEQDAGVAVAKVLEVSQSSSYVASQCHQVTHDLGREAAHYYETLGEALSFEASACWSGYYHGVVEEELSGYDNEQLEQVLPTVCSEAASERYSFTHYNCVHGVGHGVMLRFDADLFQSLTLCREYTDSWELSSCVSGAFMQNVVSAQEGTEATFREEDLVYPCNAVDVDLRDECFAMQTSYVLWRNGQDLAGAFQVCDSVEPDFADDCYQSMGRDISGNALLDPEQVIQGCALGRADLREHCIVGASLNAVFNDHDPARADELCSLVESQYRQACEEARNRAVATF